MNYPKPKKVSRKKLVRNLDNVFSKYIRARDRFCVQCGTSEGLTCGHLFSRVAYSTRWDERNCHCQCKGCNMAHEYNPHKFTLWFINKFNVDQYQWLSIKYNTTAKLTNQDLQLMILEYKDKLGKINENKSRMV